MRHGRGPSPFVRKQRHSFGVEFVLEFEDATSVKNAVEVARRTLESVRISGDAEIAGVTRCVMLCHDTRQSIVLLPGASSANGETHLE